MAKRCEIDCFPDPRDIALWPWFEFDEAFPDGENCGLRPVVDLKLMEDVSHMVLHRLFAEIQAVGDFFIGFSVRDQPQDGDFPLGQIMFNPSRLFPLFLRHEGEFGQDLTGH